MSDFDPEAMWPTGTMRLLLQAAFHKDHDIARQAWTAWEEETDFDEAGWSEMRLCAVIARRLDELGVSARNMPRISGIRRYIWAKSSSVLNAAIPVLEALKDAGVPAVILKGGARRVLGGSGSGERHIHDVDILVPKSRFVEVLDLTEAIGWNNTWGASRDWLETMFTSARHSISISPDGKREVDVHIHSLLLNRCPDHDERLLRRVRQVPMGQLDVLVPGPEDLLITACVHGQLFDPDGAQDWVGDVVDVIASGSIDWRVVLEEAERRDIWVYIYVALDYIARDLGHEIPDFVLDKSKDMIAQPFLDEYLGMANFWDAKTREIRASWGAATQERARRWAARVHPEPDGGRTALRKKGSWKTVRERDDLQSAYRIAVPEWTRAAAGHVTLEVKCKIRPTVDAQTFDIVIACFESHKVEFSSQSVDVKDHAGWFGPTLRLSIPIETTMLAAYTLQQVEIQFLQPGTLAPAPVGVRSVAIRWCA